MLSRTLRNARAPQAAMGLFQSRACHTTQQKDIALSGDSSFQERQHAFQALQADKLRSLTMVFTPLGVLGAEWIADGITHNQHLETLHFHHNQLGPDGVQHIAEAIQYSRIQRLYLTEHSVLDTNAFKALSNMLQKNPPHLASLHLELSLDDLTYLHHIPSFGDALASNTTLTELTVRGKFKQTPINFDKTHPGMLSACKQYLERNQALAETCSGERCKIPPEITP